MPYIIHSQTVVLMIQQSERSTTLKSRLHVVNINQLEDYFPISEIIALGLRIWSWLSK